MTDTKQLLVGVILPGSNTENSKSSDLVIEEFESMGCKVFAFKPRDVDIIIDVKETKLRYSGDNLMPFDVLVNRHNVTDCLPHDFAVTRILEKSALVTLNPLEKSFITHDKFQTNSFLIANGVPIPKIFKPCQKFNAEDIVNELGGFPVIIKANTGNQGKGVIYIENKLTLISVIECLNDLKKDFFVQQFVKEAALDCPRAIVVGGRVISAYGRKAKKDDFRAKLKDGDFGGFMKLSAKEEKVFKDIYKLLQLDIMGIDFCLTNKGIKIIEVNAYPGLGNIYKASGFNFAGFIYNLAIEKIKKLK